MKVKEWINVIICGEKFTKHVPCGRWWPHWAKYTMRAHARDCQPGRPR